MESLLAINVTVLFLSTKLLQVCVLLFLNLTEKHMCNLAQGKYLYRPMRLNKHVNAGEKMDQSLTFTLKKLLKHSATYGTLQSIQKL